MYVCMSVNHHHLLYLLSLLGLEPFLHAIGLIEQSSLLFLCDPGHGHVPLLDQTSNLTWR